MPLQSLDRKISPFFWYIRPKFAYTQFFYPFKKANRIGRVWKKWSTSCLPVLFLGCVGILLSCTESEDLKHNNINYEFKIDSSHEDTIRIDYKKITYCIKIKKGDIILRPFLPKKLISNKFFFALRDILIGIFIPRKYEHAELYIGEGKVLDIMPESYVPLEYRTQNSILVIKPIIDDMKAIEKFENKRPNQVFTIIRLTGNTQIVDKAIEWLMETRKLDVKFKGSGLGNVLKEENGIRYYDALNCFSGITQAFIEAGIPREQLEKKSLCFHTGYDLYKNRALEIKWTEKIRRLSTTGG